jgi:hypothetical protein
MNVFFSASTEGLPRLKATYLAIISAIKQHGDDVLDTWIVKEIHGKNRGPSPKDVLLKQNQLVQECDAMIIETSTRSFGVGYLLAQALDDHKPVLCLYPEHQDLSELSDGVKGATTSLITLKLYNKNDLTKIIADYLDGLNLNPLQKFNFVASREVLDYIEEGSKNEGKTKSEFLRDKIAKELMNK